MNILNTSDTLIISNSTVYNRFNGATKNKLCIQSLKNKNCTENNVIKKYKVLISMNEIENKTSTLFCLN